MNTRTTFGDFCLALAALLGIVFCISTGADAAGRTFGNYSELMIANGGEVLLLIWKLEGKKGISTFKLTPVPECMYLSPFPRPAMIIYQQQRNIEL